MATDGDEMTAIVKISRAAYVAGVDSRGSSAFPSSRSSAGPAFRSVPRFDLPSSAGWRLRCFEGTYNG
jgi:hypothetical protein